MILMAFFATWYHGPQKLTKSTCFRGKIGERMSGPSGMGKPAFMPASVRNQQVQQVNILLFYHWAQIFEYYPH